MKSIFSLLVAAALLFTGSAKAQLRVSTIAVPSQGSYLDFGGFFAQGAATPTPTDTLQVSDTVAYIIKTNAINKIGTYLQFYWLKGTGATANTTLTVNFYQGNDPTSCTFPLKAGTAETTYTKSITLSATGWNEIALSRDSAQVDGRYLKIWYQSSSTASAGGKIFSRLKTNVQ